MSRPSPATSPQPADAPGAASAELRRGDLPPILLAAGAGALTLALAAFAVPGCEPDLAAAKLLGPDDGAWSTLTATAWARDLDGLGFGTALAVVLVAALGLPLVIRHPFRRPAAWLLAALACASLYVPLFGAIMPARAWQAEQARIAAEKQEERDRRKAIEEAGKPKQEKRKDWAPTIVQ